VHWRWTDAADIAHGRLPNGVGRRVKLAHVVYSMVSCSIQLLQTMVTSFRFESGPALCIVDTVHFRIACVCVCVCVCGVHGWCGCGTRKRADCTAPESGGM
jgi:hypothetical protein